MGTKYSSNSASGYNSTPPVDDGTVSEANKVKWSTIKTKLADPVKTLADTINSELATHFDNGPNAYTANQTLDATHFNKVIQVSGAAVTLTLTDAATLTAGWYCDIVSTDTTNNVTLGRATASDMINETSADVTILPLQQLRVVVNAAANGFLVSTQGRHAKTYASAEAHTRSGIDTHSAQVRWARGTDIGDADVDVSNILTVPTDGNTFDFSGTQQVDEIATLGVGTTIRLIHTSARQLTHHATNLIILGGANKTTASGDISEWYEYATGDWRMTNYQSASGTLNTQTFTASGTWTKPSFPATSKVLIQLWGAGASGGKAHAVRSGGGGGGGGYHDRWVTLSDLGATETVTIGAGGAAVATDDTDGNAGGNTTFGSHLTAYGGGFGDGGTAGGTGSGGGGGGGTGGLGGNGASGAPGSGGAGGIGEFSSTDTREVGGEGGDGISGGDAAPGGAGFFGGGGGGGARQTTGSGAVSAAGGDSTWGGGGGGGGAIDTAGGTGGSSTYGGAGGAGAFDGNNATAGTQPGGGGGGSETGTSGAGADGQAIITVFG